jgi:hypothetical protein
MLVLLPPKFDAYLLLSLRAQRSNPAQKLSIVGEIASSPFRRLAMTAPLICEANLRFGILECAEKSAEEPCLNS